MRDPARVRSVARMLNQKIRVAVGVEPFVLCSAMATCLQRDPRLDVVLLPPECDAADDTVGSAVTSGPAALPDAVVVAVQTCPPGVELSVAGVRRTIPYQGMDRLAEVLVYELSGTTNGYDGGSR